MHRLILIDTHPNSIALTDAQTKSLLAVPFQEVAPAYWSFCLLRVGRNFLLVWNVVKIILSVSLYVDLMCRQ